MSRHSAVLVALVAALALIGLAHPSQAQVTTSQQIARGYAAFQKGDDVEAEKRARAVLQVSPYNVRALSLLGQIYEQRREYRNALNQYDVIVARQPLSAAAYDRRGAIQFLLNRMDEALADFDKAIELEPKRKTDHWRRGITLYMLGRFPEGAEQFAAGREVFADDVENALWHFACVARSQGLDEARRQMFPLGNEARIPLREMHGFYRGEKTKDDVAAAIRAGEPEPAELRTRMMYGHLYFGLYHDLLGEKDEAMRYYADLVDKFGDGSYMWEAGRVHYDRLRTPK